MWKKWWSCERKIRYVSEEMALRHLRKMRKRGVFFQNKPIVYKCDFCNGHHIAHERKER